MFNKINAFDSIKIIRFKMDYSRTSFILYIKQLENISEIVCI